MISNGEIRKTFLPFYDITTHSISIKSRPALILATADPDDYVVLPISRVSRQEFIDPRYDVPVDPVVFPLTGLRCKSYVRTHKQTIVHSAEIGDKIGDIRGAYDELYRTILDRRAEFSDVITLQALGE